MIYDGWFDLQPMADSFSDPLPPLSPPSTNLPFSTMRGIDLKRYTGGQMGGGKGLGGAFLSIFQEDIKEAVTT